MRAGKTIGSRDQKVNTCQELAEIANVGEATIKSADQIQKVAEEKPNHLIDATLRQA